MFSFFQFLQQSIRYLIGGIFMSHIFLKGGWDMINLVSTLDFDLI